MFKKLKDKLAEEVKSSPQRIQQFAQAAQAAVTSASSSISDITNNDLFSIGDSGNDSQQSRPARQADLQPRDVLNASSRSTASLQPSSDLVDFQPAYLQETPRQRRLSNSSFASDVSFKLPSYESPSMYHLQSDMDVSASEAEERALASPGGVGGGGGGGVSLERVTKEQLYAAYGRTQQRYNKYRTQYADLARHYKILERENAKARSVLVETQDKALRRISELREQCSLEQSAKAHLERALRIEIEERNMKIETLATKIDLLQANAHVENETVQDNQQQLIDITVDENRQKGSVDEFSTLKIKVEKMEQLVTKYKESLKAIKEKNSQLTTELQLVSNEMENKIKENEQLKTNLTTLSEANDTILQLKNINEDLQNKLNTYDFTKTKELTTLESDLQKEREEMAQLKQKIEVFAKKEEEYAISLAENKLTIHKELESKEAEIKSLKESLSTSIKEIQSINIISEDYKRRLSAQEEECLKLNTKINELNKNNNILSEKDNEAQEIKQKIYRLEQLLAKTNEEYKCLQLQLKQETAEKLAMVDRNAYLEDRIKQLNEENSKKTSKLSEIERELQKHRDDINHRTQELSEVHIWKQKHETLEHEIREEREELVKLQAEIEKLLKNDDFLQSENSKLHTQVSELKAHNDKLLIDVTKLKRVNKCFPDIKQKISEFQEKLVELAKLMHLCKDSNEKLIFEFGIEFNELIKNLHHNDHVKTMENSLNNLKIQYDKVCSDLSKLNIENDQLTELNKSNNSVKDAINKIKNEKENLIVQLKDMELKYIDSETKTNEINNKNIELNTKCSNIIENHAKMETANELIKKQLNDASEACREYSEKLDQLEKENKHLILKMKDTDSIEIKMKALLDENDELKSKFESIVNNVCELEKELTQVKKSHLEIDQEKDHLTLVLKELEKNMQNKSSTLNVESQTNETGESIESNPEENNILRSRCEQVKQEKESLHEKVILLDQKCIELQTEIDQIMDDNKTQNRNITEKDKQLDLLQHEVNSLKNENLRLMSDVSELKIEKREIDAQQNSCNNLMNDDHVKYETIVSDYDLLKEDNRRLRSDIEGLQTHLTKISKENSILNDKLREVIATSETPDTNESQINGFLENIKNLNSDILTEKVKVEELLRQNALMAEENLELRDQLQSHSYENTTNTKKTEDKDNLMHSKYKQLLKSKSELDTKLIDLEMQNKTTHNNIKHLQENNQKLRLSNEKLERRLDEALVSLRHLHALQENTELEYLKNILYEYLTGSGTHSVTLAKVLAAVVKFDDTQTNTVLQKEKERQGLLRQLGLL